MIRCKIHNRFIGKTGCPICKQIADLENELKATHEKLGKYLIANDKSKDDKILLKSLNEKVKLLENKQLPTDVVEAISYLSRNEKSIFVNLFAGESMIASVWDLFLKIPENRQDKIKPLAKYIVNISEVFNMLDTELASKAVKAMGKKEYSEMIVDTIRVLDVSAGKVKNCDICIHALDRKKIIRKELESGKI